MKYGQTQLRKVYSDHMSRLCTRWDEAVADGALKTDVLEAVVRCTDGFSLKRIEAWVDAIDRGVSSTVRYVAEKQCLDIRLKTQPIFWTSYRSVTTVSWMTHWS